VCRKECVDTRPTRTSILPCSETPQFRKEGTFAFPHRSRPCTQSTHIHTHTPPCHSLPLSFSFPPLRPQRINSIISHIKAFSVVFLSRALPMAHPAVSLRLLPARLKGRKYIHKIKRKRRSAMDTAINGPGCPTSIIIMA